MPRKTYSPASFGSNSGTSLRPLLNWGLAGLAPQRIGRIYPGRSGCLVGC